jgi:hypothetical protein
MGGGFSIEKETRSIPQSIGGIGVSHPTSQLLIDFTRSNILFTHKLVLTESNKTVSILKL